MNIDVEIFTHYEDWAIIDCREAGKAEGEKR